MTDRLRVSTRTATSKGYARINNNPAFYAGMVFLCDDKDAADVRVIDVHEFVMTLSGPARSFLWHTLLHFCINFCIMCIIICK